MPAQSSTTKLSKAHTAMQLGNASESEDDLISATASHEIVAKGIENKRTTSKTAKTKGTEKPATKRKAPAKVSRQALKDRTNLQGEDEAEAIEDMEGDDDAKRSTKRAKTTATAKSAPTKRGRSAKQAPVTEQLPVIAEPPTEPTASEDVEQSIEFDDVADTATSTIPPTTQRQPTRPTPVLYQPLQPRPSARSASVQPSYPPPRERSGSLVGTERRGGDPELRRQLNELTKSHENLKLRLESLQEIGKTQAESNFEKLKRASDQKTKDANELIASLRKELSELRKSTTSASSETTNLQKQVTTLTASNEKLTTERDTLKSQLSISQNEVKSLEAKLITARQQLSTSVKEAKDREASASTSALSSSTTAGAAKSSRNAVVESSTLKEKELQMVQNLYSDLTGLVVLGVKRKDGEDTFDCLQTGQNGTLHFHLSIANDSSTAHHPKTPTGANYEEAEFIYEPLLDTKRDRDLLELLPDYLTEDIEFPRGQAQKFYRKVMESIMKEVFVEEDEGDETREEES